MRIEGTPLVLLPHHFIGYLTSRWFDATDEQGKVGRVVSEAEARWTQQMSMHLNGGSKFSELVFRLYRDGQETGITRRTLTRRTRTNGSPKYLKTIDVLQSGDETFDILATRGQGMLQWCEAHRPDATHTESVAQADVEPLDVGGAIKDS